MQEPLVSIIVPTFNQAHFLSTAIESVRNQDYQNWEMLIVNNHSTDHTKEVIESFKDPRISCIDFANNGIIAASRNLGIEKAKGIYLAFLDSDDYWEPQKIKKCVAALKHSDLVCHGEFFFYDQTPERKPVTYGPNGRTEYGKLLSGGNCLSTSAIMVKKTIIDTVGHFSENRDFITAEDYDLWLKISGSRAKIFTIDDMLGHYRLHATSASASAVKNAKATLAVVENHLKAPQGTLSLLDQIKARIYAFRIRLFILRSQYH